MPGTVCSMASTLENRVTQGHARSRRRGVEGELHRRRHILVLGVVFAVCNASNELMGFTAVNFQEPLHFSPLVRPGQEVFGATVNFEIMMREGGGREGRPPKALELPRVGRGVPKAFLRNRKVGHDGEGELFGVFGNRGNWHRHFPFGRRTSSSCATRWRQMDSKESRSLPACWSRARLVETSCSRPWARF